MSAPATTTAEPRLMTMTSRASAANHSCRPITMNSHAIDFTSHLSILGPVAASKLRKCRRGQRPISNKYTACSLINVIVLGLPQRKIKDC